MIVSLLPYYFAFDVIFLLFTIITYAEKSISRTIVQQQFTAMNSNDFYSQATLNLVEKIMILGFITVQNCLIHNKASSVPKPNPSTRGFFFVV